MGYACPVCSDPQADAGHLANHLAFSAILGDDDHESWLDEHAPEWGEMGEDELAEIVAKRVEETEFPQLFDDTVGGLEDGSDDPLSERSGALFDDGEHDHSHRHEHGDVHTASERGEFVDTSGEVDEETAEILEEAREMTRRMHEESDDDE